MQLQKLDKRFQKYLKSRNLEKKFEKQTVLLLKNFKHPSLNIELLEPKVLGLYSFRIDRKYRAIFAFHREEITIIDINDHYQ